MYFYKVALSEFLKKSRSIHNLLYCFTLILQYHDYVNQKCRVYIVLQSKLAESDLYCVDIYYNNSNRKKIY